MVQGAGSLCANPLIGDYLFERSSAGSWNELPPLVAGDGKANDQFGFSVSISEGRAVVGARRDGVRGVESGSAYVFERDTDGKWTQAAKLYAADEQAGSAFGGSVSVSGTFAVIGASGRGAVASSGKPGSAYLFERGDAGDWEQVAKLASGEGKVGDDFGLAVGAFDRLVIVGAPGEGPEIVNAGAAYLLGP